MSVGLSVQKADVDFLAGSIAKTANGVFIDIQNFKLWLDAQTDAALTSLGYSSGEIATLRSAFTDLDQLRTVYQGTGTRAVAYDYRTFVKLIDGFGFNKQQ